MKKVVGLFALVVISAVVGLFALFVIGVGSVIFGGSGSTTSSASDSSLSTVVHEASKPEMTKAAFDQIQNGMAYDEVVKIVGFAGELQSESGTKGADDYIVMYGYKGKGDLGANAILMFQGGELMSKSQMGIR